MSGLQLENNAVFLTLQKICLNKLRKNHFYLELSPKSEFFKTIENLPLW